MERNTEFNKISNSENKFLREEAYLRAQKKVKALVGFYWHFAWYVIVNIVIIILVVSNGGKLFSFGTFATAIFWGIGLFFHFIGVYGPDFMFGKNWEKKKIEKFMEKERQHWE